MNLRGGKFMKKKFFLKPHVSFLSEGESGLPNAFPQNMKVTTRNSRISRKMKVPGFTERSQYFCLNVRKSKSFSNL